MISVFVFASLFALSFCEEGKQSLWDKIKDKATKITTGASISCNNPYISGPYIEAILCDAIIPPEYTSFLGDKFAFGPGTLWCAALACIYRGMGCEAPTYRVEGKIIQATGDVENCATSLSGGHIDEGHCETLAKFVYRPPGAPQGSGNVKRSVAEMNADEIREAKLVAAVAVSKLDSSVDLSPVFDEVGFSPFEDSRKRSLDKLAEQLQVCSPLIELGLNLIASNVKLPVNVTGHLGPCGTICNYAVCGLNILCGESGLSVLKSVNEVRGQCTQLSCAGFLPAPPSQCLGVECPEPEGTWNVQTCPPPKRVHEPLKGSPQDCCQKCDEPCNGVRCPQLTCPEPEFPRCSAYQIGKYDSFDCCDQCIDPCATKKNACPAVSPCPQGQVLGPGSPNDCCLSCRNSPCLGVQCPATPNVAADCPAGTKFVDNTQSASKCSDCCPFCEGTPEMEKPVDQMKEDSASAVKMAGAAATVATAALAVEL